VVVVALFWTASAALLDAAGETPPQAKARLLKNTREVNSLVAERDSKYLPGIDQNKVLSGEQAIEKERLDNRIMEAERKETDAFGEVRKQELENMKTVRAKAALLREEASHNHDLASTATVHLLPNRTALLNKSATEQAAAVAYESDVKKTKEEMRRDELKREEGKIKRETSKAKLREMLDAYNTQAAEYQKSLDELTGVKKPDDVNPKSNEDVQAQAAQGKDDAADKLAVQAVNAKTKDRIKALKEEKQARAKVEAEHRAKVAQFTTSQPKRKPDACACSGISDSKKQGGHCATWGWRASWCYVSKECKDRGVLKSNVPPQLTWIQGCVESDVAYMHPPGWEEPKVL